MEVKRSDLAQLALTQVGTWCYVYGGNGEDMTAMSEAERNNWIKKKEKDTSNQNRVKNLYDQLVAKGVTLIRGGDCSGFFYWCMKQLGLWNSDRRADTIYKQSKEIEKADLVPGDAAFRVSDGKATHVGIYIGSGMFVHCKGRDVGVVEEKSSEKYWQAFGRIKDFEDEPGPEPDPPVPTDPYVLVVGNSVNVRQNPMKSSKSLKIVHKGDRLTYIDTDPYEDASGGRWFAVHVEKGDGFIREFNSKNGHRLSELKGGED